MCSSLPLLACACLITMGCASLPPPPLPPESSLRVPASGLTSDPDPPITLRPGDGVLVAARTEAGQESWHAIVDAQGLAHLPGLGSARLGGLRLRQAEEVVDALVRRRGRYESVVLHLTQANGQRATVLGAVVQQGSIALKPGMRLSQLIVDSGGVLSAPDPVTATPVALADLQGAILTRGGRTLPIDLELAMRGDPRHNVFVHAGDHLYVPRRELGSVIVFGQVGAPGVFTHQPALRLTEALARAGGITTGGDKSDIRLLRGPVEAPAAFRADLTAIVDGAAPDVLLQPGDVLFVTDDPIEDLGEVLGLLIPLASASTATLLLAFVLSSR